MRLTHFLGAIALLFVVAALLMPVYSGSVRSSPRSICLSNVKHLSLGLILYAADEDRFPARDVWIDAAGPYVKNDGLFRCPEAPQGAYGYAFDGALSSANPDKLRAPETIPLLYDTVDPIRNASDLVTSLPRPGRHGGKDNVAYSDGHARGLVVR